LISLEPLLRAFTSGIKIGVHDVHSDFEKAAGRPHKSTLEIMQAFKEK